jgi:predicted transposase/invertase (TIGR01784 family)
MDGPSPSGRVLAVPVQKLDHDRLFKELLTTFFFEFLDLFFPTLAAQMDRDSIEFLSQELFPDLLDGAEYRADILVKARFRGQDAYFLIHVEHQSEAPATFPRRFFRYFSAIFEKHGLPVYPIVVYSHNAPDKPRRV